MWPSARIPNNQNRAMSGQYRLVAPIRRSLSLAVIVLGTGLQAEAVDSNVPTPIEQALIERACGEKQGRGTLETNDDHLECLNAHLAALRADYGRDLKRLSASDRRRLDSICGWLVDAESRERYLDCLWAQLVAIGNRSNRSAASTST